MYIVFAVIPRIPSDEGYSFSRKSGVYCDYISVFRTSDEEVAKAVAELLTKDYEGGPGEDYPEGFIFKSEAEMSLKERVRAHDQLSNLEDWAMEVQTKAEEYVRKVRSLPLEVKATALDCQEACGSYVSMMRRGTSRTLKAFR